MNADAEEVVIALHYANAEMLTAEKELTNGLRTLGPCQSPNDLGIACTIICNQPHEWCARCRAIKGYRERLSVLSKRREAKLRNVLKAGRRLANENNLST